MGKLKSPLLSLDARGSVADALAFKRRLGVNIVEKKPILPFFLTLPVQYQRWLYQDYAHLWTLQTSATKQIYATKGTRFHLTGFQYWMKYNLTFLPDIAAMWHLDEKAGIVARDFSRNGNNGVITGATPADGLIDGAQYFDGLNDRIDAPHHSSLSMTTALTIEAFVNEEVLGGWAEIVLKGDTGISANYGLQAVGTILRFHAFDGAFRWADSAPFLVATQWFPIAVTFDNVNAKFYVQGNLLTTTPLTYTFTGNTRPLHIGVELGGGVPMNWWQGYIDHLIIYNRILDDTEILTHSERRYPHK